MKFPPFPLVVLDTETTGFVPRVHKVIEFAGVVIKGGKVSAEMEQLFATTDEVPPHVQVLTRIRPEALKGQPTFAEKRDAIAAMFPQGAVFVGQNLSFDIGMLRGEGLDISERPWIDTSLLASVAFPELRSYSLQYMSKALGLNHEPAHRAMGDVRATLELLSRIWERLSELTPELLDSAKKYMERSTLGYRTFFAALEAKGTKRPEWLKRPVPSFPSQPATPTALTPPPPGSIALHEEGLDPAGLQTVLDAAAKNTGVRHWIAVKNLESTFRRLRLPQEAQVLYPPILMLDPDAATRLRVQETLTPEEATLAMKLDWFQPLLRADLPVHGGERDVWNGKLACTDASSAYTAQFQSSARVVLLDHRQLLAFLADPEHAAHGMLRGDTHIVMDDASMLEDTATKAYGHFCALDDLRAAAQGDKDMTGLVDVSMLWAEKIRHGIDSHLLVAADLSRPETKGMREQIAHFLEKKDLPERTRVQLVDLGHMLNVQNLETEVRWIETKINGSILLHSAPGRIDTILEASLYAKFPTTLLVPEGMDAAMPEVLPRNLKVQKAEDIASSSCKLPLAFPSPLDGDAETVLQDPPPGRTIILAQSKRVIEQMFVKYTETLEDKGIALICQGLSGGQGRMESDFLAEKQAVWLLTPWMYEGVELPEQSADHLILDCLPFDHPGQPVFAKRKNHYKDSFMQYAIPRVEHRLFRILRTFCRHKTAQADVRVIDKRMHEKEYGRHIRAYLERFAGGVVSKKPKDTGSQMMMF